MYNLTGKTIAVVGSTGGIGEGIIKQLLKNNATVIAIGRNKDKLEKLSQYVSDISNGKLHEFVMDLDQNETMRELIQTKIQNQFGELDGVIVTVGSWVQSGIPLVQTSDDMWENAIKNNLTSHYRIVRTMVPLLKPEGAFIHLSGLSADMPYPGSALIGLTNAAKKSMILTLAKELENRGPRVFEIIIGPINTRNRLQKGPNWFRPEDIGEYASELLLGNTSLSSSTLHYLIEKGKERGI